MWEEEYEEDDYMTNNDLNPGLSTFQEEILSTAHDRFNQREGGIRGAIVQAYAGCGKSFTISLIASLAKECGITPDQARIIMFNTQVKEEMQAKLTKDVGRSWSDAVMTFNSLGFRTIKASGWSFPGSNAVKRYKYYDICRSLNLTKRNSSYAILTKGPSPLCDNEATVVRLVELLRSYLLESTADNIAFLTERHELAVSVDSADIIASYLEKVLSKGIEALYDKSIDFQDQIWLPCVRPDLFYNGIAKVRDSLRFVAVDEAQDTDPASLRLLDLLIDHENCFFVGVGDRYQSVYEFKGCFNDGMDKIQETFDCTSHVLPVSYRCGTSHLHLVRHVFPHINIEANDLDHEGSIDFMDMPALIETLSNKHGDFLGVCRAKHPLTLIALRLLIKGIPVEIKGEDFGKSVVDLVRQIDPRYHPDTFLGKVSAYLEKQKQRDADLEEDGEDSSIELEERVLAVRSLFNSYRSSKLLNTLAGWESLVENVMANSGYDKPVLLSTIHAAKGLEADTVFIISPDFFKFETDYPTSNGVDQEWNLLYVALTRSKRRLLFLQGSSKSMPRWISGKVNAEYKVKLKHCCNW